jgi:uncharacterized protein (TIGR02246 family)
MKMTVAVLVLLVTFLQPASAEESAGSIVNRLNAQYDKAWNTLDARKLAEQFTADAILVPPGVAAALGPQAVIAFFEPLFKGKWSGHKLETMTAQWVGPNAISAASHWSVSLTDADGKTTRYHGDVAQVFERKGGQWKLKLSSWNVVPDAK